MEALILAILWAIYES